jgi:hypothetical protein
MRKMNNYGMIVVRMMKEKRMMKMKMKMKMRRMKKKKLKLRRSKNKLKRRVNLRNRFKNKSKINWKMMRKVISIILILQRYPMKKTIIMIISLIRNKSQVIV